MADVPRGARALAAPLVSLLALAGVTAVARQVHAEPNVSVAATVGGGASDVGRLGGPAPLFQLGARADLLLLRRRDTDMAIGPYIDFATAGFSTAELGGGVEWLLPVTEHIPIVLSVGGLARTGAGTGWEPGAVGTLFVGSKSLNFGSLYGFGAGLFLQGRIGLGNSLQADVILGAHLDFEILSLPFVLAFNALRH